MGESCELPELQPVGVNAGLFTAGAFSKLADENLGVTAGLSFTLSDAFAGGATAGVLSKLGGEHLRLIPGLTPTLSDAFGGGLTTGVTSKLADENLGVTAGLSSTLSDAFAGGATAGVLSRLVGAHFGLTAGLASLLAEPLGWDLTAGRFHRLPEWNPGGITAALFPDLPELDSVLTESLREPVADADVAWAVKSSDDSEADPSLFHPCAGLDPPGGQLGWSRGGSEAPGATKPAATSMRTGTSTTWEYQRHHAQRYADGIAHPVSKPPPPPSPPRLRRVK